MIRLLAAPSSWRQAVFAPESADERRISSISDVFGNPCQGRIATAEEVRGKHHSPLRKIFHRRTADEVLKSLGEYGPRSARCTS
jgi:hypothetical protein